MKYIAATLRTDLVAEELRAAIALLPLLPDGGMTVSIEVATLREGETWEQLMKRSDDNLYRAKSTGRDRVMA